MTISVCESLFHAHMLISSTNIVTSCGPFHLFQDHMKQCLLLNPYYYKSDKKITTQTNNDLTLSN